MKKSTLILSHPRYLCGDLYLFHPYNKHCPSKNSLWGIYDRTENGKIYLESSTLDNKIFRIWHPLPSKYCYSRRATRAELRDYMYNMGYYDSIYSQRLSTLGVEKSEN